MPERIQETEIQITQKDKERIICKIRNSENFKSVANDQELSKDSYTGQLGTSDKIVNVKYPEFYSREIYTEIDNYPTRFVISIYEKNNIIKFQRIED